MTLSNSTITANTAGGRGGGIRNLGAANFQNTIIARNEADTGPDCSSSASRGGTLTSLGYNLVGAGTGCPSSAMGDHQTVDPADVFTPVLGPLQDNGGPTDTHALLAGSPAIDAGNPAGCTDDTGATLTTDQRGVIRPQGTDCDIGSFEFLARIEKVIASGPDNDGVGGIDLVVEVGQLVATEYDFDITYTNPGGPDVVVLDTTPAEWQVTDVAGIPIVDGFGAGNDGNFGTGTVDVAAANKKTNNKSATKIEWTPDPSLASSTINVVAETRPTSCGALVLNDGAKVFELDPATGEPLLDPGTGEVLPPILESEPLVLAAVEDLNGSGLVRDGSGDEDADGLTDLEEVSGDVVTDPCLADTDGDGVNDNLDQCPLRGLEETGAVNLGGCPITP